MKDIRAVLDLGDARREYEFTNDRRQDPPILHISGNHRGPSRPLYTVPARAGEVAEQPGYYMKPYWYCQWRFMSSDASDVFIECLKAKESEETG